MNRYTVDMTGVGDYVNGVEDMDDPTTAWDCAPAVDCENSMDTDVWMKTYVEQHKFNELNRISWVERQKNSVALRAKFGAMADPGEMNGY